jgi:GNAT superfamily N-acetyltransferase
MSELEIHPFTPTLEHPWTEPTLEIMQDFMTLNGMTSTILARTLYIDSFEYYGLQDGDTFVGFGSLNPGFRLHEDGYDLPYLGITAEDRCKGYGSFMLKYLENLAYTRGQRYLYVHSTQAAIPFYKRHDYERKDRTYLYKLLHEQEDQRYI